MSYSLDVTQQQIIDLIEAEMAQPLYEISVPEPETVKRNKAGQVDPYIALQFGDLSDGYSETFGGAATNDFWLPVYLQTVAPTPQIGRKVSNKLLRTMLGYTVAYGGQVRKRMGGKMLPIGNMDGTMEAYIFPVSFGVKIQLFDDV